MIPLSVDEQKEVEAFLDDQLVKGYIRPSVSPQTSPVFFVPKKGKHMVQDYQYLNEWTIKNNYPLPLISQLVDKLKDVNFSQRWIFTGGITMSGLRKVMSGRLCL